MSASSAATTARTCGVRLMALGARTSHVLRLVFRQGIIQLAIGLTLGLGLGALVSQGIANALFEVQPRDPLVVRLAAPADRRAFPPGAGLRFLFRHVQRRRDSCAGVQ